MLVNVSSHGHNDAATVTAAAAMRWGEVNGRKKSIFSTPKVKIFIRLMVMGLLTVDGVYTVLVESNFCHVPPRIRNCSRVELHHS